MSKFYTITCPHCRSTTTVQTGVSKNGTGIGQCKNCNKTIKITVDGNGMVRKVN